MMTDALTIIEQSARSTLFEINLPADQYYTILDGTAIWEELELLNKTVDCGSQGAQATAFLIGTIIDQDHSSAVQT